MRKETRTLSLCLLGVILGSIAATENRYEKTTHVDKYTEYIGLGPHPLLDIKYLSGDKELFGQCKGLHTPINHYVDIPYRETFKYKFAEVGFFQTIYYDNDKNILLHRYSKDNYFFAFDLSSKTNLYKTSVSWELGDHISEMDNKDIHFIKDISEKNLDPVNGNYVAFLHKGDQILIIHFNHKLRKIAHWHIKIEFGGIKRIIFYKKTFYILLSDKIVSMFYGDGFDRPPYKKAYLLKREYNDMAMTREGVFLFIRGYSELVASPSLNPEHKHAAVHTEKFHHGNFVFSGYSNFMLNKTKTVSGTPLYYYFDFPKKDSGKDMKVAMEHRGIPELSIKSHHKVRFVQTKHYIYYMYPKDPKIKFIEVYVKGSKFGKNLMKNHIAGHVESLTAGYSTFFTTNRLVVEKQNHKYMSSKLIRVYSNFLDSAIKCDPTKNKALIGKEIEMLVQTTGSRYGIKVVFGEKPWRKLAEHGDNPSPKPHPHPHPPTPSPHNTKENKTKPNPPHNNKENSPNFKNLISLIAFGLVIFVILIVVLACFRRSIAKKSIRETEDIVNDVTLDEPTNSELEMSQSDIDTVDESSLDVSGL